MDQDDAAAAVDEEARVEPAAPEAEAPAPAEDEDPLEAVEHDGRTYRVSRGLRAEYERQGAELAAERRALRQAQDEVERARALAGEHRRIEALNARVAAFDGYDWDKLAEEDPRKAHAEWVAYMRARDGRDRLAGELQREHARRLEQGHAELARDIQGWSPEVARKLTEFGRSIGFSDAELGAITDARQIKLLHTAWREQQRAAADRLAAASRYAPAPTVGGASGRIETAADTDDFLAFERFAAGRKT